MIPIVLTILNKNCLVYLYKKMQFQTLVKSRQSTRKFSHKQVEKEKLMQCIEAARLAPSACNAQPWKFVVVQEPNLKDKVAKSCYNKIVPMNKFVVRANAMIVIVKEKRNFTSWFGSNVKDRNFPLLDIGIAAEHICLQAEELSLGSCLIGWFNEKKVKKLLDIPSKKRIGLIVALGYPEEGYRKREKTRKSLDEVVSFDGY